MKIEARVAEVFDALPEFVEGLRIPPERCGDFHTLAEVKTLERGLVCKVRVGRSVVTDNAAEIAAQRRDGNVVANVQRRELLGEIVPVSVRERPLREIVGKTLGKKMMAAKRLKGVMKNRRVAAMLEPGEQLRECARGLVANPREIGNRNEFERGFSGLHSGSSCGSAEAEASSQPRCKCEIGCGVMTIEASPQHVPEFQCEFQ